MGELAKLYGLAAVAFVGGSLVPKGGHDILQPLFHGVPTLFGPHMQNQRALAELALGAGAARQVEDLAALSRALTTLLQADGERVVMQAAAARLIADNRGAAARCAAVVAELIHKGEGSTSTSPPTASRLPGAGGLLGSEDGLRARSVP